MKSLYVASHYIFRWLVGSEASPILSFARAAVLGYSSNGNPAMCYRAFPRCPRNPDKLVHYLNNHNGGFFRFFSRSEYGSLPQSSYVSRGKDSTMDLSRTTFKFKVLYALNSLFFSTTKVSWTSLVKKDKKACPRGSPERRPIAPEQAN